MTTDPCGHPGSAPYLQRTGPFLLAFAPRPQAIAMAPMQRSRTSSRLSALPRQALDWLCAGRSDYQAFQQRKRTRVYRRNRTACLYTWAGAAGLLLVCGATSCLIMFGLIATLICFTLLDPD